MYVLGAACIIKITKNINKTKHGILVHILGIKGVL